MQARLFALVISCFIYASASSQDVASVRNTDVDRNIDLASQLVKVVTKITVENAGKSPLKSYLLALTSEEKQHLAYLGVTNPSDNSALTVTETQLQQQKNFYHYRVDLATPIAPGKSAKFEVEATFTNLVTPHPSHITQAERQLVLYQGSHYFISPYGTKSQTTKVVLPSAKLESYSKLRPVSQSEATLTYGPYENAQPYGQDKMVIHYENNNPFLTVTNLGRSIEVSHWGVISVEEVIDVRHSGAVLKGSFSRYEYQRDQNGVSSVKSFRTVLPASASDVYYRDEIGNISTSHLRTLDDSVEVDIRPRFPLFGGWKTHYVLGYYVPTYEYLYNLGDQYLLKMRFVDHVFDDSVVEKATVRIILPEGVKDIRLKTPYGVTRLSDGRHYTYLDTIGRPVVVLQKSNLVEQHIQDFEIHYTYKRILMLQEPLLVVVALYLLFLLVVIYVRLDFTITKDPAHESKLQVSGLLEKVAQHQDKRVGLYAQYDAALGKYKTSKDSVGYQAVLKKINAEHKTHTQAITDLVVKLKQEGAEALETVNELQRLDRNLKEQFQQQMTLLEKLMTSKLSKSQYVEAETNIQKKKEELAERMSTLTATL
uniref:Dolichyl-diphosphooligosaccharide--protein glycosyltransferase subunit 1 n=1 Tax=Ornithodoros turicata TaxID=34597 RepID=A0A2R5LA90_9ACAR